MPISQKAMYENRRLFSNSHSTEILCDVILPCCDLKLFVVEKHSHNVFIFCVFYKDIARKFVYANQYVQGTKALSKTIWKNSVLILNYNHTR